MPKVSRILREYFYRSHTATVCGIFADWLKTRKAAPETDDAFREIWDELNVVPDASTEASFLSVRQRIEAAPEEDVRQPFMPLYRRWLQIAATLLIPLISVAGAYLYVKNATSARSSVEFVECFVPNGEIREVTLPDSSVVQVNSGSILIYPKDFVGDARSIYLNGEASFAVARNEKRPFIVKTSDMDIEVLGTVFNVSAYHTLSNASTTLKEGKVSVRLKKGEKELPELFVLSPDEQLVLERSTGKANVKKVNVQHVMAWQKGYLLVDALGLGDIAGMLERKYDVTVRITSGKYEGQRITAKFKHNESLAESLSVLKQLIPGMKYVIEGNKVYIY